MLSNDLASAASIYEAASRAFPDNWQFPWMLAICRKMSGDSAGASAPLTRAGEILAQSGDTAAPPGSMRSFRRSSPACRSADSRGRASPKSGNEERPRGTGPARSALVPFLTARSGVYRATIVIG